MKLFTFAKFDDIEIYLNIKTERCDIYEIKNKFKLQNIFIDFFFFFYYFFFHMQKISCLLENMKFFFFMHMNKLHLTDFLKRLI